MEVMHPNNIWRIHPESLRRPHKSGPQHSHSLTKLFTSSTGRAARACRHLQALQPERQYAYAPSHNPAALSNRALLPALHRGAA